MSSGLTGRGEENRCAPPLANLKARQQLATKGVRNRMRILKVIMIVAVLAGALSLGACAQKKETMATDTTAARTYSK